ncbi:ABC transporter permease, partial [Komagataeibacter melaceti]
MSRFVTLFCAVMAAVSGLFLYNKKQQTTALDHQIAQIVQQTERTRSQTAMLRAEWAMLNQPDRLASLASRYDKPLQSVMPAQFVQMSALASHLPAIGSAPVHPAPAPRATMVATLAADHVLTSNADAVAAPQPARVVAQAVAAPRVEHATAPVAPHHDAPPVRAMAQNETRAPVRTTPVEHVRVPERIAAAEPAQPAPLRDTVIPP